MVDIWSDPDVAHIFVPGDLGRPLLRLGELPADAGDLVSAFLAADRTITPASTLVDVVDVLVLAVRAVETLPSMLPDPPLTGWLKFVLQTSSYDVDLLNARRAREATIFASWILERLEAIGVRADGFASAVGSAYSQMMNVPDAAVSMDPSGVFRPATGDVARRLAGVVPVGVGGAPARSPELTAAGWFPDPTGRHQLRYADGAGWSVHVADHGVQATDPL